jgi:hypothetical protein
MNQYKPTFYEKTYFINKYHTGSNFTCQGENSFDIFFTLTKPLKENVENISQDEQ